MSRLLTPPEIRRLLDEHGLAPRRSAGQNFVGDPNTVRAIVRDADLGPDDVVLEVGPGLGSLTRGLVEAAGQVIAVEVDAGLVRVLRDTLGDRDDCTIIHADVMDLDLDTVAPGGLPLRLVANLPYNLATPIVATLLQRPQVRDAYVMVQREVGERWGAHVGHPLYAAISVKLQLIAEVTVERTISRQVFYPVPNVDSVMVRLARRADAPTPNRAAEVGRVVEAAFAQRRKTLRNTLQSVADRETLDAALAAAGIDTSARAEELDVDAFVRLATLLDAGDGAGSS